MDNVGDIDGYGFKQVDFQNLTQPDPLVVGMLTRDGDEIRPITPEDFVSPILAISLAQPVPLEVRRAFYFARNVMCYGYWYWPAITLGSQQVLRVADLASCIAGAANGLKPNKNFGPRIGQLRAAGVIGADREQRWNVIVKLRNIATHPDWQQTWGMAQTVQCIEMVAFEIQSLRWLTEPSSEHSEPAIFQ